MATERAASRVPVAALLQVVQRQLVDRENRPGGYSAPIPSSATNDETGRTADTTDVQGRGAALRNMVVVINTGPVLGDRRQRGAVWR
jgi:hypothetical protein